MPVVLCPHCDQKQTVSRELAGLTAKCSGCGEGMQIPLAPTKPPKSASSPRIALDEPEAGGTDLRKTLLLLGGLIVGVLVVLGVLLSAVSSSKKETPSTAPATAKAVTPPERDPDWSKSPTARGESGGGGLASVLAMGYVMLVLLTVLFIGYAVGVFGVGVVVARDAATRGLQPLPWVAAYFLFHAAGPMLGVMVATPLMVSLPPLGVLAGGVLGLVASWYGALMYLAVRRPGKKALCPRCRNPRLAYLVTCPHCGVGETTGEPRA